MKKISYSVLFGLCGLVSVCFALLIASQINMEGVFPDRHLNGCWELDHCQIPSWYWIGVVFFMISPIGVFAYRGFCLSGNRILIADVAKQVGILFFMTVVFEIVGRVVFFFVKTV